MNFTNKSLLITGGTGSLGTAICKYLINNNNIPERLIIFSTSEEKQDKLKNELGNHSFMRYIIGNVRDYESLCRVFENVDYVIHAAAMKRIDICEQNVDETYRTNIKGSENVVKAALNRGVKKTVLVSTDKACNPCNTYGISKAAAEKYFMGANIYAGGKDIKFGVVRYGNVIGSAGSVIPIWRKMINEGAEYLPITDCEMTRFVITMEQAIEFVIDSLNRLKGTEDKPFIPRLPSIRITDLAAAFNMPYKIVGIRTGEKIHESLETGYDSGPNSDFLSVEQIRELI